MTETLLKPELLQLGSIAVIFIFAVKEFFSYLKTKNSSNNQGQFSQPIFNELQRMNNNHLHSIQEAIEKGNGNLINTIHSDNIKIIELLGELKGGLRK